MPGASLRRETRTCGRGPSPYCLFSAPGRRRLPRSADYARGDTRAPAAAQRGDCGQKHASASGPAGHGASTRPARAPGSQATGPPTTVHGLDRFGDGRGCAPRRLRRRRAGSESKPSQVRAKSASGPSQVRVKTPSHARESRLLEQHAGVSKRTTRIGTAARSARRRTPPRPGHGAELKRGGRLSHPAPASSAARQSSVRATLRVLSAVAGIGRRRRRETPRQTATSPEPRNLPCAIPTALFLPLRHSRFSSRGGWCACWAHEWA